MRTHQSPTPAAPKSHESTASQSFAPPPFQLKAVNSVVQRQKEADACNVSSPQWEEFAEGFNTHFSSVLHVFNPDSFDSAAYSEGPAVTEEPLSTQPPLSTEAPANAEPNMSVDPSLTPDAGPQNESVNASFAEAEQVNDISGKYLPGSALSCLFTTDQRDMLLDFFSTNVIPDRLFNGDNIGSTNSKQRILMAGVILSKGEYAPGSFMQRVHARFCGHWNKLVWHYAGVTPAGNMEWAGVSGNLDHDGNIVLGNGKEEGVFSGRTSRTYLNQVDGEERDALTPDGTGFSSAYDSASEKRKKSFQRYGELPLDDAVAKIEAGDWLYYFNGNGSASGNHSVIFSRWSGGIKTSKVSGIRYRTAIAFSQGTPSSGGKEHTVNIGDEFQSRNKETGQPKICPVTKISRVSENAGPADSVADVLGGTMSEGENLSGTNVKYQKLFKRRHKNTMDVDLLREDLRDENSTMIEELAALEGDRLTDGQETLLRAANTEDHVENLVRLTRRLRAITTSVRKHDENREEKYVTGKPAIKGRRKAVPGMNEKYESIRTESNAKLEAINTELAEIDSEMGPTQSEIARIEEQIDTLGHKSEIKELRSKLNSSYVEMKKLKPRSPERNAITSERVKMMARKKELQGIAKEHKPEVAALEKELKPLKKQIKPLERRRAKLEKQEAAVNAQDPWGYAHTGNNKTGVDKTYNFRGDIEAVRPYRTSGHLKSSKAEE